MKLINIYKGNSWLDCENALKERNLLHVWYQDWENEELPGILMTIENFINSDIRDWFEIDENCDLNVDMFVREKEDCANADTFVRLTLISEGYTKVNKDFNTGNHPWYQDYIELYYYTLQSSTGELCKDCFLDVIKKDEIISFISWPVFSDRELGNPRNHYRVSRCSTCALCNKLEDMVAVVQFNK